MVILGAGYTGLWSAYYLRQYAPDCRVVVLEQDICGGGPSGRNGGFASGWWDELPNLVQLYGRDGALAACRAIGTTIREIGDWCTRWGVDAWFTPAGSLQVASSPMQDGAWEPAVRLARELGAGDEYQELTAADVQARCQSPAFGRGVFMQDAATVQPARLARGVRRVALDQGIQIFEQTPALGWEAQPRVTVRTPGGTVRAQHAILGLNAWAIRWRPLHRSAVAWSSYIVLTAPAPDRLGATGWINGECINDFRSSLHYFRTTPDGRIAFGGGGGRASARIDQTFTHDARAVAQAAAGLRRLFPGFADVPIEDGWGGPIDVSPTHLPVIGTLPPGNLHYALGYTGNGVAPSHLAGRVLAALALGLQDERTQLPMVNPRVRRFPPEPLRSLGARVAREAMVRVDDAGDQGRTPGRLASLVAGLPRRMGYLLGPE